MDLHCHDQQRLWKFRVSYPRVQTSAKDTDTLEKRESANWTYLEYILQECDERGIVGKFEANFILVGQ